jgi:hypothetical protein
MEKSLAGNPTQLSRPAGRPTENGSFCAPSAITSVSLKPLCRSSSFLCSYGSTAAAAGRWGGESKEMGLYYEKNGVFGKIEALVVEPEHRGFVL